MLVLVTAFELLVDAVFVVLLVITGGGGGGVELGDTEVDLLPSCNVLVLAKEGCVGLVALGAVEATERREEEEQEEMEDPEEEGPGNSCLCCTTIDPFELPPS